MRHGVVPGSLASRDARSRPIWANRSWYGTSITSTTYYYAARRRLFQDVAAKLGELLGKPVAFAADCVGADAEAKSKALKNGEVLLLENVRYHAEEEKNDAEFARQLSQLCDGLFVCDAFGSAHRAHASVVGITKYVQKAAAGSWCVGEGTFACAGAPQARSDTNFAARKRTT